MYFQENQDSLLQCVMQDVGFNNDRPIAAYILYKSLLQWRSFEAERTNVFDRIIQTIGTAIEVSQFQNVFSPISLPATASLLGPSSIVRFTHQLILVWFHTSSALLSLLLLDLSSCTPQIHSTLPRIIIV